MTNPVEAIHEAYCTLRKGGYLIIHDLYLPHPSNDDLNKLEQIKKSKIEHAMRASADHSENDSRSGECKEGCQNSDDSCSENCQLPQQQIEPSCPDGLLPECTVDGALIMDDIYAALNELELEKVLFEDREADLTNYAASMIFSGNDTNCCRDARKGKSKMSYFLMAARKADK